MSRKFSKDDHAIIKTLYLSTAHFLSMGQLSKVVRELAEIGALPEKWKPFHFQTGLRWRDKENWKTELPAEIQDVEDDDLPVVLPTSEAISDRLLHHSLEIERILYRKLRGADHENKEVQGAMRAWLKVQAQLGSELDRRRWFQGIPDREIVNIIEKTIREFVGKKAINEEQLLRVLQVQLTEVRSRTQIDVKEHT